MASAAPAASLGPEEEVTLVKEVLKYVNDEKARGITEEQEKLAHKVANAPEHVVRAVVKNLLDLIDVNASSTYILELFAWLLLYNAIDPLQILQLLVLSGQSSFIEICGTSKFADDVIEHLKLRNSPGRNPQFSIPAAINPVFVDILDNAKSQKTVPLVTAGRSTSPSGSGSDSGSNLFQYSRQQLEPYEEPYEEPVRKFPKSEPKETMRFNSEEYAVRIRKAVKSSMSAEEASHKILKIYAKNTANIVANALLDICCEQKVYDRMHGNLAARIQRTNNRVWAPVWSNLMAQVFKDTCESLDADRLKVAGSYFGHILASGGLDWAETFSGISLDSKFSTPSNRIFFITVLREIRQEVGVSPVEGKILTPQFEEKASNVLSTDLAAGFWDLAGFQSIAQRARKLLGDVTDHS